MASECERRLRDRPGRRNRWRASGKAETGQEGLDHLRLGDHSQDLTAALAADTFQNIEVEDTAHQACPWQGSSSKRREAVAPLSTGFGGRSRRLFLVLRTISNDGGSPLGPRRKDSVICGALDYAERCGQCPANLDVTTRSWHVSAAQLCLDNSA